VHLRRAWLVTVATATLIGGAWPATAVAAPSPAVRSASAASDAAKAVQAFRASMSAQLREYMTAYGSRLTPGERARADALILQSDVDLKRLATLTAATADWERRGNQARAQRAARTAVTAYEASYARAEAAINEFTPILQPYLNVFEALDAKAALDRRMSAYRSLGGQVRDVTTSLRRASFTGSAR